MIRLHHGTGSSHGASVRIALVEKALDHDLREYDLATFGQFTPEALDVSPSGQFPVLDDGKCRVRESFFILLYLDEAYPQPALGGDTPKARYLTQKWGKYVETHVAPNLGIVLWATSGTAKSDGDALASLPKDRRDLWATAGEGFTPEEVDKARLALDRAAQRLSQDLARGDWLAGNNFSIADIAVYPHAARLADAGVTVPDNLSSWLARMAQRPSVTAVAEPAVTTMGPERGRWG